MRRTALSLVAVFLAVAAAAATHHLGRAEARSGLAAPLRTHPALQAPRSHATHLAGLSAEVPRRMRAAAPPGARWRRGP